MIKKKHIDSFNQFGYVIIKNWSSPKEIEKLKDELQDATNKNLRQKKTFDQGMIHNCFMHGPNLLNHIGLKKIREATDKFLCKNSIIYAYQSSSLAPYSKNYGSRIHVDSPRFIPNFRTNLGYILPLDDFTHENGATHILPGSHKTQKIASLKFFNKNYLQVICNAGDAIFFDGRLVHKAGVNKTPKWRYALTINFCRPYMRSRFDFPRLIKNKRIKLNPSSKAFLGFNVRVPVNLKEFYLPKSKRLYLPNQE